MAENINTFVYRAIRREIGERKIILSGDTLDELGLSKDGLVNVFLDLQCEYGIDLSFPPLRDDMTVSELTQRLASHVGV